MSAHKTPKQVRLRNVCSVRERRRNEPTVGARQRIIDDRKSRDHNTWRLASEYEPSISNVNKPKLQRRSARNADDFGDSTATPDTPRVRAPARVPRSLHRASGRIRHREIQGAGQQYGRAVYDLDREAHRTCRCKKSRAVHGGNRGRLTENEAGSSVLASDYNTTEVLI